MGKGAQCCGSEGALRYCCGALAVSGDVAGASLSADEAAGADTGADDAAGADTGEVAGSDTGDASSGDAGGAAGGGGAGDAVDCLLERRTGGRSRLNDSYLHPTQAYISGSVRAKKTRAVECTSYCWGQCEGEKYQKRQLVHLVSSARARNKNRQLTPQRQRGSKEYKNV
jgi:hypothetical protein